MDLLTHDHFERLSAVDQTRCVSIFLPTHRTGTAMQQDPIRLKNLLREAENQLSAAGMRTPDVTSLLQPATALLPDQDFWQHQSDGLAVFASAGHFASYRVPLPLDELVVVAQRFQLKPLLPMLVGDGHFYILALSQNEVRLFEATRHGVDEIDWETPPENFREAVGLGDQQKQLQFHTRASGRGGQRAAMFHGHGPGDEVTKELLVKYFRQIDEVICGLLKGESAPLVLAGVDYYFPIYREVSRYRPILGEGVAGNPELLKPEELHRKAWPLVEPVFQQERDTVLARYRQFAGTGRTLTDVAHVLPAAHQGRVEAALVATDRQQWGTFDPQTQAVDLHPESAAHNEDLLDRAAIETYLKGGQVYALPSHELPDGAELAAICRF
jgi:hypothetical protein